MPQAQPSRPALNRKNKLSAAKAILYQLRFGARQRSEMAGYTLLALIDLAPEMAWAQAQAPLCGIAGIIEFVARKYGVRYAPNTRETIRDEAVKYFVEAGLLLRNPDKPDRPTTSPNAVYQIEPHALDLLRVYGSPAWEGKLADYLARQATLVEEIKRSRLIHRVAVTLPDGAQVALSPGGQNPLIKAVIEEFCPIFAPGGTVLYIGDTEDKFVHLATTELAALGIALDSAAKVPDVIVHHAAKNWLLLIEVVTSAGPVDAKRRNELKRLFATSTAGLVFVTAFATRRAMQSFTAQIAWESEVWVAEDPDHLIHFNGERFLGPYPDVQRGS